MNKDDSFQTSSNTEVIQFKQIRSNQQNFRSKVAIFFFLLSITILLIYAFNNVREVSTNIQQQKKNFQKNTKELLKQQITIQSQKEVNLKNSKLLNQKIEKIQQNLIISKQNKQPLKLNSQNVKITIQHKGQQKKQKNQNKKKIDINNQTSVNNKENIKSQQNSIVKLQSPSTNLDQKQSSFKVGFIWQGQMQQRHIQKLKKLKYQFRLIRNCSKFLNDIEQITNQPIHQDILNRIGRKSNLCRLAYLYKYGGLYLDVDAEVDYQCMQKFIKENIKSTQVFFQATPKNTIDIFAIYVSAPKNPNIKHIIEIIQTYYGFQKKKDTWAFSKIPPSQKIVKHSNCIKHISQRTWKK